MRVMLSDGFPLTLRGAPAEAWAVTPRPRARARPRARVVRRVALVVFMGVPRFLSGACLLVVVWCVRGRPPDPRAGGRPRWSVELVHRDGGRLLEGLHRGVGEVAHLGPLHDGDGPVVPADGQQVDVGGAVRLLRVQAVHPGALLDRDLAVVLVRRLELRVTLFEAARAGADLLVHAGGEGRGLRLGADLDRQLAGAG